VKLVSFRVTNFRSVNDSGPVGVAKVTTLVGRNESGKTNLLLALRSLNPPGGVKELSAIKDFPRSRRMSECAPDTKAVSTIWELDPREQLELAELFPRAKGLSRVEIGRYYQAGTRWVGFPDIKPVQFNHSEVVTKFNKLKSEVAKVAEKMEAGPKATLEKAIAVAEPAISEKQDPGDWAATAKPALKAGLYT
jgi:hypothetical protein